VRVVADWLDRRLLVLILVFVTAGLAWPAPARGAVDGHGITIALIVLVAAVGLGLRAAQVLEARVYALPVTVAVLVPVVALPAIAFGASRVVPAGPLRLGVLAAGVAPSEVAAVALAALAGGSAALSAAVLLGSTVACVALAGPILRVLAGSGHSFSSGALLLSLLGIVGAPLAVAALIRSRLPARLLDRADTVSSITASVAVLVLIWLVSGQAHLGVSYLRAGLALLLYLAGATLLAAVLTVRLPWQPKVSLLLPMAMRDFAIAAGIASQAFGSPASGALGLYGVLVLLLGATAARSGRRPVSAG
jgi:predicted Na+-dependent transporter